MSAYEDVKAGLKEKPRRWLVTGCAGFIGSHLLEELLRLDQVVVGLDNFSTGKLANLAEVERQTTTEQWQRFTFIEGDIRHLSTCQEACYGVDYVLHHAALGSVPRSIDDPLASNENNVTGSLNILVAVRDQKVRRMIYAASSSTYGDHPALPKVEDQIGRPLSPYAVTKYVNELYAEVFFRTYGVETIGLRYFNVFGSRQDPDGAYAAVIPKWIAALIKGDTVYINGNGETSRDFCYVKNVVQMNLLAALTTDLDAVNQVYNTALNQRTTLNDLYSILRQQLASHYPHVMAAKAVYRDFRNGDVMHSLADIDKAKRLLGYQPSHTLRQGMDEALEWYRQHLT